MCKLRFVWKLARVFSAICTASDGINTFSPKSTEIILASLIIGAIIGAAAGFGVGVYLDYKDDGLVFNGSIPWYDYLGVTVVGGMIGACLGAFSGTSFNFSLPIFGLSNSGGAVSLGIVGTETITITGAQVLEAAGAAGIIVMMSKHRPGMTNKPPFTWTTQEEGIEAMKKYNGDANKAADYIMNNHFKSWKYGAGNDRNVIKKWLDRIIRKILG